MNHELRKENGQAMIVTTLFMSGLILVATTVAGFLVSTQIRQATDTEMSARAIFAADAATKAQPKEMLPIVDKPIIQYLVEEAVHSGVTEIILVTGRGKRAIEDHFDYSPSLEGALQDKGKT